MTYKSLLANKTGTLGPKNSAYWPKINGTTGPLWSLGATPIIYNTTTGLYNTAYDANAADSSASFAKWWSYGKTRRSKLRKHKRRKWKSPSRSNRKSMMLRCGKQCFLGSNLSFPICTSHCSISPAGLEAAYKRARQYKHRSIAKKAKSMMKRSYGKRRKSRKNKRRGKRSYRKRK